MLDDPPRTLSAVDPDDGAGANGAAQAPPEARAERLGAWLRDHRETRGLDLARVEGDTKIGRRYLEAIERDEFEVLPAPVYARGFVRGYARYLGLDQDEAIARMPQDLPRPRGLEPLPGLRRREGPPAVPSIERRWLALAAAAAAVVVVAVVLGVPGLGGDGADEPASADGPTGVVAGAEPAATVPPFDEGRTPDFRGVERAEAEQLLAQLGLTALVIEVDSADAPAGRVFAQSPDPDTAVEPGDDVTLIVSRGAPAE